MGVFVIAEAGSSHDNDLSKAYRLIEAAKECGADAVKFQWTSSGEGMAWRRKLGGEAAEMYTKYLEKPVSWLQSLKAHADQVGIEFMCTVYLIEDIATIAPLVKRFKVSAYESNWIEFVNRHLNTYQRETIVSTNAACFGHMRGEKLLKWLHCVSMYPTPLHELRMGLIKFVDGFSDHSTSLDSGGWAVHEGAKVIEKHIRLSLGDKDSPDYGHSLWCDRSFSPSFFQDYVERIRAAEKAL